MRLVIDPQFRVNASATLDLNLPAAAVWGQMRDVARFLSRDPLHVRVEFPNGPPDMRRPRGAALILAHRLAAIGPDRVGRILTWREGIDYAVSDLSRRGNRVGFPHICTYRVDPIDAAHSRLTLGARGRWTATWVPRALIRLWIGWVLMATERRIRLKFDALAAWRRTR